MDHVSIGFIFGQRLRFFPPLILHLWQIRVVVSRNLLPTCPSSASTLLPPQDIGLLFTCRMLCGLAKEVAKLTNLAPGFVQFTTINLALSISRHIDLQPAVHVYFYLYWGNFATNIFECECVWKKKSVTCDDLNRDMMMLHLWSGDIMLFSHAHTSQSGIQVSTWQPDLHTC